MQKNSRDAKFPEIFNDAEKIRKDWQMMEKHRKYWKSAKILGLT